MSILIILPDLCTIRQKEKKKKTLLQVLFTMF